MSFLKKENFLKVLQSMNLYKKIFCNTKDANKSSYTIKEHDHNTRVIESHTYKFLRNILNNLYNTLFSILTLISDHYHCFEWHGPSYCEASNLNLYLRKLLHVLFQSHLFCII